MITDHHNEWIPNCELLQLQSSRYYQMKDDKGKRWRRRRRRQSNLPSFVFVWRFPYTFTSDTNDRTIQLVMAERANKMQVNRHWKMDTDTRMETPNESNMCRVHTNMKIEYCLRVSRVRMHRMDKLVRSSCSCVCVCVCVCMNVRSECVAKKEE